jgi:hypothetical protein
VDRDAASPTAPLCKRFGLFSLVLTHQPSETGVDHRLSHRLENMNQFEIGSNAFGDDSRSIGHAPTHGG